MRNEGTEADASGRVGSGAAMRSGWVGMALVVVGLAFASEARAQVSVRAGAGGVVGAGGGFDAAPGAELQASLPFADRWRMFAGGAGWTLGSSLPGSARTELLFSSGAAFRGDIVGELGWSFGAGPALLYGTETGQPALWRPALMLAPALELGTRRRTVTFQLGAQAAAFVDGVRALAGVGMTYTFQ